MLLEQFHSTENSLISFSRQQASAFAKQIAGDFNPIHDVDAKRFCVPGDLLFSLVLARYGISQQMRFNFSGMVGDGVSLIFPEMPGASFSISDGNGKDYLDIQRSGPFSQDPAFVEDLTRRYVEFSGKTFPHILVPLMEEQQTMINPDRPLVIYESMEIQLDTLDTDGLELVLDNAQLQVNGKRGDVRLKFYIRTASGIIGTGTKNMVMSGLRAYDQDSINQLVETYNARKTRYAHDS